MDEEKFNYLKKLKEEQDELRRIMIKKEKELLNKKFKNSTKEEVIEQLAILKVYHLELKKLMWS